ncbi:BH0509 family protein [Cytobacillus praedii]|uniref:BH0509 family protein n=1 Tax=Cytobacillus praedii TaxID=1742358 RepID=UPI00399C70BC
MDLMLKIVRKELIPLVKLDAWERDNMISVLEWRTAYSREYLRKLNDEQLDRLYKERVG